MDRSTPRHKFERVRDGANGETRDGCRRLTAQKNHHEGICLEVPHRRRVPDPSPLEAVLQPDQPKHQRRDHEDADHPLCVEVEQARGQTVELQYRLQRNHERLQRVQHRPDVRREVEVPTAISTGSGQEGLRTSTQMRQLARGQ